MVAPKKAVKIRSGFDKYDESAKANWSDEDWLEWQARGIAPRILMPPVQFDEMANRFIGEFSTAKTCNSSRHLLHRYVVNSLAAFFNVSKQSAEIRLGERGFHLLI